MKTMKLTEIGENLMDHLCGDAGSAERDALGALLGTLPKEQRFALDQAIGDYGVAVMEQSFLAGVEAGRNPLALLVNA